MHAEAIPTEEYSHPSAKKDYAKIHYAKIHYANIVTFRNKFFF